VTPLFDPLPELISPDPLSFLSISEAEFKERWGSTPLARARARGIRRNASVVLGNVGGPEAVDPLARALGDPEPLVREHAAWALEELARRHGGDLAARCLGLIGK
jgi:epoxyqueuosine reductase